MIQGISVGKIDFKTATAATKKRWLGPGEQTENNVLVLETRRSIFREALSPHVKHYGLFGGGNNLQHQMRRSKDRDFGFLDADSLIHGSIVKIHTLW